MQNEERQDVDGIDEERAAPETDSPNMEKQVSSPPKPGGNKDDKETSNSARPNTEAPSKKKPPKPTPPPILEGFEPSQEQINYARQMQTLVCPPKYKDIYPTAYVSHDTYSGSRYCYYKSTVKYYN